VLPGGARLPPPTGGCDHNRTRLRITVQERAQVGTNLLAIHVRRKRRNGRIGHEFEQGGAVRVQCLLPRGADVFGAIDATAI
jgi:hypothetical protein